VWLYSPSSQAFSPSSAFAQTPSRSYVAGARACASTLALQAMSVIVIVSWVRFAHTSDLHLGCCRCVGRPLLPPDYFRNSNASKNTATFCRLLVGATPHSGKRNNSSLVQVLHRTLFLLREWTGVRRISQRRIHYVIVPVSLLRPAQVLLQPLLSHFAVTHLIG
jgi:hypothetical protein